MLTIDIADINATAKLGRILAQIYSASLLPPPLLLQGGLGAGKTTLVRYLVENLPGGRPEDGVEVSSPSFTLCNSYSCTPDVLHFDLYRLEPDSEDDNFDEAVEMLEREKLLLIVEWPERIKKNSLPQEFILVEFIGSGPERKAIFSAKSPQSAFSKKYADEFLETLATLAKTNNL
jgi:tRNA threonylcarbamoyladenosine biosynthesis protein TsaE